MRQRAMIAMALACGPKILIADEPTTALDVTTQAEVLRLIKRLQTENGLAVLFITHDMGVVAQIADEVLVMYQGQVVERGPVETIFHCAGASRTRDACWTHRRSWAWPPRRRGRRSPRRRARCCRCATWR